MEREIDVVAGDDRAEALGDADQLDRRWGAGLPAGDGAVVGHGWVVMRLGDEWWLRGQPAAYASPAIAPNCSA